MQQASDAATHQPLPAVTIIIGSDSLLVKEAVQTWEKKVLPNGPDAFNSDVYRAGETPIAQILDAARTLPMMAPRRWLHVTDLERLRADDQAVLLDYVKAPIDTTFMCLSGAKLDGRTKLGQFLKREKRLQTVEPPGPRQLPGWLMRRAQDLGYALPAGAAQLLVDLVGNQVGLLVSALGTVTTYAGEEKQLTESHIEAVASHTSVATIFALTDAVGMRDGLRVLSLIREIVSSGEAPLLVLSMVARQLRLLLRTKVAQQQQVAPSELAGVLGVRPFVVRGLQEQAQQYSERELIAAVRRMANSDLRLKQAGRLHPATLLEAEVLAVVARERRSPSQAASQPASAC